MYALFLRLPTMFTAFSWLLTQLAANTVCMVGKEHYSVGPGR